MTEQETLEQLRLLQESKAAQAKPAAQDPVLDAPQAKPADDNKEMQHSVAKALIGLAPILIGAAAGGNAGGATGAQAGMAGLGSFEKGEEKQLTREQAKKKALLDAQHAKLEERKTVATESDVKTRQTKEENDVKQFAERLAFDKDKLNRELALRNVELKLKANEQLGGSKLSASQAERLADHESARLQLNNLASAIESNKDLMGPAAGSIATWNPYNIEAQSLNAQLKIAAQNVSKSLEGGKLSDQDIMRYRAMLPNISDDPRVAMKKLEQVQTLVAQKQNSDLKTFGAAGYGVKNIEKINAPVAQKQQSKGGGNGSGNNAYAAPVPPDFSKMSDEQLDQLLRGR